MADPTEYDVIQDSRIEDLEQVVTTGSNPPDGSEYSYPVVNEPMSDEQWQYVTLANGNGILDTGGFPYNLVLNGDESNTNSTNSMRLTVDEHTGTAQAIVRGFYHRLTQDKTLSFPGVTSTTTYYVVLRYDPIGHTEPGGPIKVDVVTSLDTTQGKHYVVLWTVTRRANQLLTDASIQRYRPRAAGSMYVWDESHKPDPGSVLWGSLCVVGSTGAIYRSAAESELDGGGDATKRAWVPMSDVAIRGDNQAYVSPGHGARIGSTRIGELVVLEGRVVRANGNIFSSGTTNGYLIHILPERHRPARERRFITKSDGIGSSDRSAVVVVSSDGEVRAYPNQSCNWVAVDGCVFTVRL